MWICWMYNIICNQSSMPFIYFFKLFLSDLQEKVADVSCVYVKGASKSEKAPNGSTYLECAESDDIKKLLKWTVCCLARLLVPLSAFITGSHGPTFFHLCVFRCYFVTFLCYLAKFWQLLIMAVLCNRGPLYFCPVISIYRLLSFFSRLISAATDWISTILLHMVWP